MVQGYYTLEEAASILKMSPEKLTHMAQKREVRAFADRGTWRFRTQDVEEMARRLGQASDEVPSMSNPTAATTEAPATPATVRATAPPKTTKPDSDDEPLGFDLSPDSADIIDLGKEHGADDKKKGKKSAGESPAVPAGPRPGSDSDVHIVTDSDDDFQLSAESGVKVVDPSHSRKATAPLGKAGTPTAPTPGGKKTMVSPAGLSDSEAQLVPLDDSSDVNLGDIPVKSPSDSDVRLDPAPGGKASGGKEPPATEEMQLDLDSDLFKAEEAAKSNPHLKATPRPKTPDPEKTSPFELSAPEINLGKPASKASKAKPAPAKDDDEITLGDLSSEGESTSSSGINLSAPADSGIDLGKGGKSPDSSDEIEFELSLDADSTPQPAAKGKQDEATSSSEFELTLDDSGGLAPLEEKGSPAESAEKDIFETDLEVPALDEESASEVVPLDDADTDLESSDFDFDPAEAESGSQVVALDEDVDDSAATVARKGRSPAKKTAAADAEEEIDEVDAMLSADTSAVEEATVADEGEEAPTRQRVMVAAGAPAEWGALPAVLLLPSVLLMFVVGLMSFELLHDMWGYKQPSKPSGVLIKPISQMLGAELPAE